ncbi:hypothetical protein PATSB16_28730 [Pandoraea thiooxydans]|nr:hypothetical protein PATSB16_28730 [Pandoraea thiooxydans]
MAFLSWTNDVCLTSTSTPQLLPFPIYFGGANTQDAANRLLAAADIEGAFVLIGLS